MIAIKMEANKEFYPKKTVICPKCSNQIMFWNAAPSMCLQCKTVMPSIDLIMSTLYGRIEYYKCTREKW